MLSYKGGHVWIKINDQVGKNFQTKKGLRQGDPLSSILFNIVAEMLAILINRAKEEGQVKWIVPPSYRGRFIYSSICGWYYHFYVSWSRKSCKS